MARFRRNRFPSAFLIIFLVSSILASSFGVVGCQALRRMLFGEGTKQPKDDFLKRLKSFDVPGRDLKDLPRYPGSRRITYTILTGEGKKKSGTIVYRTKDKKDKVIDFYRKTIVKNDWTTGEIIDTMDGKIFQLFKPRYPKDPSNKERRHVSLNIARRSKTKYTEITMIYREY